MKHSIIKGTLILTLAGLLTRVLGFLYKIFLASAMTTEKMGLYQLIFPVYGLCFTLYASGTQTAISKLVAESNCQSDRKRARHVLFVGFLLSVSIAVFLFAVVFLGAPTIAARLLDAPEAAPALRILSYIFPFCSLTACINGYYYGTKQAGVPAATQLLEQIVRVSFVYLIAIRRGGSLTVSCELAVLGLIVGEISSACFNLFSLFLSSKKQSSANDSHSLEPSSAPTSLDAKGAVLSPLLKLVLPLTGNRFVLSLLHTYETILIPVLLKRYGLSSAEALSVLGILQGMTMPFLMFPSAVTNALSVLLLPAISEAKASNNNYTLRLTALLTIKYSLLLGFLALGIFYCFGQALGDAVFSESRAGYYLTLLSLLCPFFYVGTTLGSILNGLGSATATLRNSMLGCLLKIAVFVLLIPRCGLYGYFVAMLANLLATTLLDFLSLRKEGLLLFDVYNMLWKPMLVLGLLIPMFLELRDFFLSIAARPLVTLLVLSAGFTAAFFAFLFLCDTFAMDALYFRQQKSKAGA